MPDKVIPLTFNFLEPFADLTIDEKNYERLIAFLFPDGAEPVACLLGTVIAVLPDGSVELRGMSLVKESAYASRLRNQRVSLKLLNPDEDLTQREARWLKKPTSS